MSKVHKKVLIDLDLLEKAVAPAKNREEFMERACAQVAIYFSIKCMRAAEESDAVADFERLMEDLEKSDPEGMAEAEKWAKDYLTKLGRSLH